jgi:hypothetical protein
VVPVREKIKFFTEKETTGRKRKREARRQM